MTIAGTLEIEDATAVGESTPFIEFILEAIWNSIQKRIGNLTENQMMMLDLIRSD